MKWQAPLVAFKFPLVPAPAGTPRNFLGVRRADVSRLGMMVYPEGA